jgi:hypothetical protein
MAALNVLILTLIAKSRPERLGPDDEVENVNGRDILSG